jgi:hypothetical protein
LAGPYLAADNSNGTVVAAFPVAQSSGQGQIEFVFSTNGGGTWSTPALLAPSLTVHQFFPFLAASVGRVSAIWYTRKAIRATRLPNRRVTTPRAGLPHASMSATLNPLTAAKPGDRASK